MAKTKNIVHSDPEIMSGIPVFVGTRVPVKTLFDYLAHNHNLEDFLEDFPSVRRSQAVAALEFSCQALATSAHPS